MSSLLVAAFLATNMLSLVYMVMIAVGMAARVKPRRRAWRFVFVPLLGLLLLFQYTVLIWSVLPELHSSFSHTCVQCLGLLAVVDHFLTLAIVCMECIYLQILHLNKTQLYCSTPYSSI